MRKLFPSLSHAALGLLTGTAVLVCGGMAPEAAAAEVRNIVLKQDDAQIRFASRYYELKNVVATDILPYVQTAILRYNANSTVHFVAADNTPGAKEGLLVTTGEAFIPYLDELIAALDRPGKPGPDGSMIEGTGMARISYVPKYRAAPELARLVNKQISSQEGRAYVNEMSNTIFWRDEKSAAETTLRWVQLLDRPLPQVRVRFSYYEMRDSTLRDVGFDYLAWKNGPGVNLFNVGYNAGSLAVDELFTSLMTAAPIAADFATGWGYGGFMTAPHFDMSFIRILQQSGHTDMASTADLAILHTPIATQREYDQLRKEASEATELGRYQYQVSLYPEYQNIAKNTEGRSFIGASFYEDEEGEKHKDPPILNVLVSTPIICLPQNGTLVDGGELSLSGKPGESAGGVIFEYELLFKNVVERGNTGSELSNSAALTGAVSLGFRQEKVLTVYEKEDDIRQTIGIPILCRIPILKYLFSTTTTTKERTYIVVTAEAEPLSLDPDVQEPEPVSAAVRTSRRWELQTRWTRPAKVEEGEAK